MGRAPRCSKDGLNKGAWTALEDEALVDYVKSHGERKWSKLAKEAGLNRCGKSCRLRWMNYLRPGIKRGNISEDEEELITRMHKLLGNRWTLIAGRLPGRTDNEIKNYWNSYLSKKMKDQFPLPKPGIEEKPVVRLENENKVAPGPSTDNDMVKNKSTTSELSSGLPQSITGKDKEEAFMLDLNSEDLFRRLDCDLAKLGIVDMNKLNPTIEGSACPFLPSEGIEDSGYGTECGHDDNNNKLYDLRSPLLHSDDGWLGDFVHTLFSD